MLNSDSAKKVQFSLDKAIHAIGHAFEQAGRGDDLACEREMGDALKQIKEAASHLPVLSNVELKMRNCDRFDDGEAAWSAFDTDCMGKMHGKEICRAKGRSCSLYDSNRCFAAWIVATLEKGVQS